MSVRLTSRCVHVPGREARPTWNRRRVRRSQRKGQRAWPSIAAWTRKVRANLADGGSMMLLTQLQHLHTYFMKCVNTSELILGCVACFVRCKCLFLFHFSAKSKSPELQFPSLRFEDVGGNEKILTVSTPPLLSPPSAVLLLSLTSSWLSCCTAGGVQAAGPYAPP